jgi:ankyrin repeat protein
MASKRFPEFLSDITDRTKFPNVDDDRLQNDLDGFADFWVTDYNAHAYLKKIAKRIDTTFDSRGWSLLLRRVSYLGDDDVNLVKMLLALGVNPDVTIYNGWSPLHYCAADGMDGSVDVLLDCRADASHTDDDGDTAFDVALRKETDAKNSRLVCIERTIQYFKKLLMKNCTSCLTLFRCGRQPKSSTLRNAKISG